MSYLMFFLGVVVGAIGALAIKANQHHSSVRKVVEEVDDFLDSADDKIKERWKHIREKF